ncbi:hypothetical protein [Spirillospora sp. NPDC029432]|uniref:hypothetical protein n=1 Tax=Spirillospora sp. NPDC029432 TaxID=3154599 RepID=UPI0034530EA6
MTASDDIAELERAAQRLLDGRVAAIRELAVAKQARDRLRAELDEAEREYGARYTAAERAGWQDAELKELDFTDPERRPRGRPRTAGARRKKAAAPQRQAVPEPAAEPAAAPVPEPEPAAEPMTGNGRSWQVS